MNYPHPLEFSAEAPPAPVALAQHNTGTASADEYATVELALFAPYNEQVELIAEWLAWKPLSMTRGADGWWRTQAKLDDGSYRYHYRVKSNSYFARGEMKDIADPYGLETTDDAPENTILRVKNGKRPWVDYQWQHDASPLPENAQLVIYEMHIGDFTGSAEKPGTFLTAIARLDYLRDLGFNAVELLPVKEFPGRGWGYSLKSLFGVENTYGTPEELCRFVDECHARQMRVIIDGVYNHAHADAYLAQIDYEYWFYRHNPDGPEMDWGPKYNYEYHDPKLGFCPARKYVTDSITFWIEKFHIDGLRFDATAAIRKFDVLRDLANAAYSKIEGVKPFLCVAEHIPEDPAVTGRERGAPMDAAWHAILGMQLQATLSGVEQHGQHPNDIQHLTELLNPATNGYEKGERTVTFVGNHDYRRPMQILGEDGKKFGAAAFRRMKLGHALLIAAPGLPMVWMGSEFGMPGEKTMKPLPLDWSLIDNADNRDLLEYHRRMINFRRATPALQIGDFEYLFIDRERQLIAFRRSADGQSVVAAVNLRDEAAGEVVLQNACLTAGRWRDALSALEIDVNGEGRLQTHLGPSQVRIFVKT